MRLNKSKRIMYYNDKIHKKMTNLNRLGVKDFRLML